MRTVRKAYRVEFFYEWDVEIPDDVTDAEADEALRADIYDRVAEDDVWPETVAPSTDEYVSRVRLERDGYYLRVESVDDLDTSEGD